MFFYDGKKIAEIIVWASNDDKEENKYDFTNDFFQTGALHEVGEYEGKTVYGKSFDIDGMIDYAKDFVEYKGEFKYYSLDEAKQYRDYESTELDMNKFVEYED